MNFVSYSFALLFVAVLFIRFTIGRRATGRAYAAVLLVSSLVFYGWHVPAYLFLLFASALIDYAAGEWLDRHPNLAGAGASPMALKRRLVLAVSLTANLGLIAVFKYADFFGELAASLLGRAEAWQPLGVVLPIGISFYTFQSMSYTIDIYRGTLAPARNFATFLLFISFFPQLVAGPIVRASELLPQIGRVRRIRLAAVTEGVYLMISGFFLKVVCADNLAIVVNDHWDRGYAAGTDSASLVVLVLLFSGQIFCDFAGYSNIARGAAYLLGYRLPINFNAPYIADSFKNFWERWHITLSRWLRDYLYVPLGGNRGSRRRTYVNLLLVMALGGLWHGAAVTFVVWGILHGVGLAVERLLGLHRTEGWRGHPLVRYPWAIVVQLAVLVTWVFFRSSHVDGAFQFLSNIAALRIGAPEPALVFGCVFLIPVVVLHVWQRLDERGYMGPLTPQGKGALAGVMVTLLLTSYGGTSDFIYFQF
jgi:alginate O-acetyltransferase complex protein AlgI